MSPLLQCTSALPVFLRTGTLEDAVGQLKPHARFRHDELAGARTRAISVLDSPVELLPFAQFSLRAQDLSQCSPAPAASRD